MSQRIFITGGSGLLAINWALAERNRNEIILGLHNRKIVLGGCCSVEFNTFSFENIVQQIRESGANLVIHTAGLTSVELCEQEPELAIAVNTALAADIAKACSTLNIKMVHISTDHLFNGEAEMVREDYPISPLNMYGATKANAEIEVSRNNPDALIVRTNFYGWGPSYRKSFSDVIISTLRSGKELTLFDDVFYTPILAEKLIFAVNSLLDNNARGIYNVVGDERISKFEFGLAVAECFNLNASLIKRGKIGDKVNLVKRPIDMSLSNKKVTDNIGYTIGGVNEHLNKLREQEISELFNEIIRL